MVLLRPAGGAGAALLKALQPSASLLPLLPGCESRRVEDGKKRPKTTTPSRDGRRTLFMEMLCDIGAGYCESVTSDVLERRSK